jgi:CoA:oxalate CoA-transferase
MFVNVEHPVLGSFIEPGFPIKSLSWVGDVSTPAPLLGQHNVEVLHNLLGLDESDVDTLLKEGVI